MGISSCGQKGELYLPGDEQAMLDTPENLT